MSSKIKIKASDALVKLRRSRGLTQKKFWSKVGVTQSGGSRFENGRKPPLSVAMLIDLVYIREVELQSIKKVDLEIVKFMLNNHPDLYNSLLKNVSPRSTRKAT